MKYYVGFGLTYGNFYIMDKQGDVVWFDKPFNLTRNVIDEFSLDVDLIIEQYVILVNKSFEVFITLKISNQTIKTF